MIAETVLDWLVASRMFADVSGNRKLANALKKAVIALCEQEGLEVPF